MAKAAAKESEQVVSSGVASATPFDIIKSIFISYFGEERIDIKKVNLGRLTIWIHFPQITITNSYNRKHIIKDLYVEYSFNPSEGRLIEGPKYMRATISNLEYGAAYIHSHCSSSFSDFLSITNSIPRKLQSCIYKAYGVCTGSGPINNTMGLLSTMVGFDNTTRIKYTDSMYKTLLTTLCLETDRIVRWESIEGGPYRLIANIKSSSGDSNNERYEVRLQSNPKGILSIFRYPVSGPGTLTYYNMYELAKQILLSMHKKGGVICTVTQKDSINYILNPVLDEKLLELEAIRIIKETGNYELVGALLGEILASSSTETPTFYPILNKIIRNFRVSEVNNGFTNITQIPIDGFTFKGKPVMMTIYPVSEGRANVQTAGTTEILYDNLVVYPLFVEYVKSIAPFIYSYNKQ